MKNILIFCLLAVLLMTGCTTTKSNSEELVILCGNSFIPPTESIIQSIKEELNIDATFTTGGSEDLLPHVKAKKQGDIYITHDPFLDYTKEGGAYSDHAHVGFVAPVIAVQKGNPKSIKSINDLSSLNVTVALSDPKYSTCGEMVFALIEKKNIKEDIMKNVGNRLTKGHTHLGNLVKTGSVDAVIMWNGVANTFKDDLEVVKTPYEYDTEIRVHVIGLNYSKNPEKVKKVMTYIKKNGMKIFKDHGYVK